MRASLSALALEPSIELALKAAARLLRLEFGATTVGIVVVTRGQHRSFGCAGSKSSQQALAGLLDDWLSADPAHTFPFSDVGPRSLHSTVDAFRQGDDLFGLVALQRRPLAFTRPERLSLGQAARAIEAVVRQLQLIETIRADRKLLEAETRLFARTAGYKTRDQLVEAYAQGLHETLEADAVGVIEPEPGRRQWKVTDWPRGILAAAGSSTRDTRNRRAFRNRTPEAYYNPDLRQSAESPAERGALAGGQRSFLVAEGRAPGRRPLVVTATSRHRDFWGLEAQAVAARLATVLQLSLDRLRTIETTRAQGDRLAAQAHLLTSLDPTRPLPEIADAFAAELRARFTVDYVAVVRIGELPPWQVLYIDPLIGPLPDSVLAEVAEEAAYGRVAAGETATIPLTQESGGAIERRLYERGVRWLIRTPVRGERGVRGFVTMGSARPLRFRPDELEEFIRPLGLALDRSSLLSSLEQRSDALALANDILRMLSGTEPIEEVCQLVASRLREHFQADHVALGYVDLKNRRRALLGWDSGALDRAELPDALTDDDIATYGAAREGSADLVADLLAVPDLNAATALVRDAGVRTFIRAPFRVSEDLRGLVTIGSLQPNRYTPADAELLLEACRPVGLALDRAAALGSVRSFSQQALAHNRLLQELSTDLPEGQIAALFASIVRDHFAADAVVVSQLEEQRDRLKLLAIDFADAQRSQPANSIRVADPRVKQAIVRGRPFLTPDVEADPVIRELRPNAIPLGLRAFIDVPFAGPLGMRGLVSMASGSPGKWSEADMAALAEFTSTLAERLELRSIDQEAREHTRRIETTNRVLSAITGHAEGDLAGRFLTVARETFGAEHGVVWWFDEFGQGGPIAVSSDLVAITDIPPATPSDFDDAWGSTLTVVIADVTADPARKTYEPWLSLGIKSVLATRLVTNGRTSGAIILRASEANQFTRQQADVLEGLAGPLGLALERERALASLAESESKYRSLVDQAEELIFVFDGANHAILESNAHAARILGYTPEQLHELQFDDLWEGSTAELEAAIDQVLATGELRMPERFYRTRNGALVEVEIVASRIQFAGREAVLTLARELSERRSLQRQLLQSQKMESLGTMAGQVAHDFNNLLTTIMGFSGLLKRSPNISSDERENLELIEQAARRGADLTGRLLTFARGGFARYGPVDVGLTIGDTLKLVRPTLHQHMRLEADLDVPAPLYVEGDGSQLQQAFLNILLNARDAMPEGGLIRVKLSRRRQKAVITITDTGPGMDEETRLRIFEPFFTTKASGSGTGLGLAITYGIVQGHKGELRVTSAPGEGATFTILLPLTQLSERAVGDLV